jgi:DNA segregation ATPase FtsK/SpoIIIE, S-DNA-T family
VTRPATCPRCGGPLDAVQRCAECDPQRGPSETVVVPVQGGSALPGAAVPAGDDLGRVALPDGWEIALDVTAGPAKGQSFRLTRSRVLIGRGPVDLPVNDPRMSRRHASLEVYGSACVLLKDLGSTNGTFVNGRRVTACELTDGDEIRTGNSVFSVTIGTPP